MPIRCIKRECLSWERKQLREV